jgi:tripartite-type tricarboxylate transporter receptor subunit TctC
VVRANENGPRGPLTWLPVALAVVGIAILVCAEMARAQPSGPIRIVVPFPPGGPTDILIRVLAEQVARTQASTLVIENRPGASGAIGSEAVSRAQPDGRTLLVTTNSFVIDPLLHKVSYDPIASFAPICDLAETPMLLVVNGASPYRTLADLMRAAHARPGELTLGGTGPATSVQIAFEKLKRAAAADMIFVPYPGAAPSVTALLGAHVTSALVPYVVVAEHLQSGALRALATVSRRRTEPLPDLPTAAEAGYAGVEADLWTGLVAPARTPSATLSQLAGWFAAVLAAPEIKSKLVAQGQFPVGICGDEFAALMRAQYAENGRVISAAGMKAE